MQELLKETWEDNKKLLVGNCSIHCFSSSEFCIILELLSENATTYEEEIGMKEPKPGQVRRMEAH